MKREQRKKYRLNRYEQDQRGPLNFFSENQVRQTAEKIARSSERRFEDVRSSKAIIRISQATKSFQARNGLKVIITGNPKLIPNMPSDASFKYSQALDVGSLSECEQRVKEGEKIALSLICEEGLLIGYGIAAIREAESEIEIIDVDDYSRRGAGLKGALDMGGQSFQVGVGHAVVMGLLEACSRPIKVDATNSRSRYVFKSVGFVQDSNSNNPCILRME